MTVEVAVNLETPESCNIQEASYNPATKALVIAFRNGSRYSYAEVPLDIFEGFAHASSRGSYLAKCIKGRFHYTKLEDAP